MIFSPPVIIQILGDIHFITSTCKYYTTSCNVKSLEDRGCQAGSISGACDSWSGGSELKSHIECRDNLKSLKIKREREREFER